MIQTPVGEVGAGRPFVEPAELLRLAAPDAEPDVKVLGRESARGVTTTEISFRTEVVDGHEIRMHAWLARPERADGPSAPLLLIPGGRAATQPDAVAWIAGETSMVVLGVDWIGGGLSSRVAGLNPWANAIVFEGDDIRSSFQLHNLRGFLQATGVLLAQPDVGADRLAAMGGSWGGFYSLLLAGIDTRFSALSITYGAGFLDLGCRQIWQAQMAAMSPEQVETWLRTFDPGRRAHLIEAAVFYAQATNDRYFSLDGTMATYHALAGPKRLLLAHNQDHSLHPYERLNLDAARAASEGRFPGAFPSLTAAWVHGTNVVEVSIADVELDGSVKVVHSAGSYAPWGARQWLEAGARRDGERWRAEIPIVEPSREIWFYGHADGGAGTAGSSPVFRATPAELGVDRPTARPVAGFDFGSNDLWRLPVGDPENPRLYRVSDDGRTGLSVIFDDSDELRAVAYCLEGDLIEAGGYDGIELFVRAGERTDVSRFELVLVTDYNTFEEQDYCIPLASLAETFTDWTPVSIRFAELSSCAYRVHHFAQPPVRPLDVGRLCAIGFRRARLESRGKLELADIRLVHGGADERDGGDEGTLRIRTNVPAEQLRERLRAWAPWRHEILFSNGVRTSELERGPMFVERPLDKWRQVAVHLPLDELRGGRALDVGSNIGHNSLALRRELGMTVTGVENNQRNLEVARFLLELANLDGIEFVDADASTWRGASDLDLVLHFGTLDHLRHPLLALENTAAMLRPGGCLALELQVLVREDDEMLCRYVGTADTSTTCCWFLGRGALLEMLAESGFKAVETVLEWRKPELLGSDMARLVLVARRSIDLPTH